MNEHVVFAVLRWYKSRSMSKALDVQYAALCNVTIEAHCVWCWAMYAYHVFGYKYIEHFDIRCIMVFCKAG